MRILIVEDEPDLNQIVAKMLTREGYSVDACFDGTSAMEYAAYAEYDAIILDIMLPHISGLEVLQGLRAQNNKTPILLLTARDSIEDRVCGLNAGADDYLIKPFAFDELLARIRVMLRRSSGEVSNVLTLGDLVVNCDARTVTRGNRPIALSTKEFSILEYLLRNKGVVLSRDKIGQHVWNFDYEGSSNVVDVYIRYLRKKMDEGFNTKLIHTIRGAGYVLRDES